MENNYSSPQSNIIDNNKSIRVTTNMLKSLNGTKPWIFFIGIICFVLAFLIFSMTIGSIISANRNIVSPIVVGSRGSLQWIILSINIVLGVIMLLFGIFMVKYSSAIAKVVATRQTDDMENMFLSQAKYWKLAGISTLFGTMLLMVWIIFTYAKFRFKY